MTVGDAAELAIVVPTLNEAENVPILVGRIAQALDGTAWEIVFVDDDSVDDTRAAVAALAAQDRRIRLVHRIGRRGLSSACIEGALATTAPYIAVIDADLQHDETLLPRMLALLRTEPAVDLVIGSRYVAGGSVEDWDSRRAALSDFATRLGRFVLKANVTDPMSGFFMIRRASFAETVRGLSGVGFKILVDLFASSPRPLAFRELPYQFRQREHGESKLDARVAWEYLSLLWDKTLGTVLPMRFVAFSAVGALGLVFHLLVLRISLSALAFPEAQSIATLTAMVMNFLLNNAFTYRDRRLHGWAMLRGLLWFCAVCGLGAVANVGIASWVFGADRSWWAAGIAGALVSSIWNYGATSLLVWNRRGMRALG